jgi:hypothetical protein
MSTSILDQQKKERLVFEEAWRDAETVDELLSLYHSQPSFLVTETAKIVYNFRRYCWKYKHVEMKQCLAIPEFRVPILEASKSIWNDLVNNLNNNKGAQESPEIDQNCISTFHVILNEPIFQAQVTEVSFLKALKNKMDISIIKEMMNIASQDSSSFHISCSTLSKYKRQNVKYLHEADVIRNIEMLQEAIDIQIEQLNSEGRYVNQNIITCFENECKGDGMSFFTPFLRADYGDGEAPYATIELELMSLSRLIRLKDNWREKCMDSAIQARWRSEVQAQGGNLSLFELALQQTQLLADVGREEGYEASPVDHVYSSDSIIPAETLLAFREQVAVLEGAIPVDFHPGSNEQVVDTVHPSLFPLVAGRTRVRRLPALSLEASWKQDLGSLGLPILTSFDHHTHTPLPHGDNGDDVAFSKQFQWLPAEFQVEADATVHINSYINNLHPERHQGMYPVLAKVFGHCLPLLEQVLSDNILKQRLRMIDNPDGYEMYDDEPSDLDCDDDDAYEAYYDNRVPLDIPLPESFPAENIDRYLNKSVCLRDKRLQVIVKLATIELTPDKPEYSGGAWHVEGMQNEAIVCTLIHYYSCENITESRLNFRQAICEPEYEQSDDVGVAHRFGLADEDPLNQELGYVVAKEGRSIAFPNLYQHSVQPFELADRTLPGHRKILVYFLVDPFQRLLSTADVPPQQRSWVARQYDSELHQLLHAAAGGVHMPEDVIAYLFEFLEYPLSRSDAEDIRAQLMKERSFFVNQVTETVFERPFSLCEH